MLVLKGQPNLNSRTSTPVMVSTYFPLTEAPTKLMAQLFTDDNSRSLSGAKGTTQSPVLIWQALTPALSLSGASRVPPNSYPWYLSLTHSIQSN